MIRLITTCGIVLGLAAAVAVGDGEPTVHWNADPAANVFKGGMFDQVDDRGHPLGWDDTAAFDLGHATLDRQNIGYVRLRAQPQPVAIRATLPVDPAWTHVTFVVRLRGPNITLKDSPHASAGVVIQAHDERGTHSRPIAKIEPLLKGGYRNWAAMRRTVRLEQGDRALAITIELADVTGDLDVDEMLVIPTDPAGQVPVERVKTFHAAIDADDGAKVTQMLADDSRLLEARNGACDNGTPLIVCAWHNKPAMAKRLLDHGADHRAIDTNWKGTALSWCGWWGRPDVARVLLDGGCDANYCAPGRITALSSAMDGKEANSFSDARPEDYDAVIALLRERGGKMPRELGK